MTDAQSPLRIDSSDDEAMDYDLPGLTAGDPSLAPLLEEVLRRMRCDAAHDLGHLLRVGRWTIRLLGDAEADGEGGPRLAVATALLHDVVNVAKTDPGRIAASDQSAAVARELLPSFGFLPAEVELAADAIRDHSYTRGTQPASALGRALQDADRLDALGAIGVFRCIATGVRFGAAFYHADDPWATRRSLDDARFSLDHFFTKLLRLPPTLLTAAGRAEAARRAAVMRSLLAELGDEIGTPLAADLHAR
jgi:uncharacterized protein